jgi:uncharacterized protein YdeI (YjbR/CyaY-like superfamily)
MKSGQELEQVEIDSRAALRAWLSAHHARTQSVWLVVWKKAAGARHVPYDDIVEEALCFGWIDSLPRKLDDERSMLLLSPRKRGSAWSRLNKQRLARLLRDGLVEAPGLAVIEAAKQDGSWSRLDSAGELTVPDDLLAAFEAFPGAQDLFNAFPPSTRRAILELIAQARTPPTRARRVEETARQAQQNIRANQPRQPKATHHRD